MIYSQIGNSGVKISALSLGTMHFTEHTLFPSLMNKAIDAGVNYIDTADNYAAGEAEIFLGNVIKNKKRDSILLGTKCYFPNGKSPLQKGLGKKHIMHSVETSLKRMKTDYIDLFFCHRYDYETPMEETLQAIQLLIEQGKILYWGLCAFTSYQVCEAYYKAKLMNIPTPVAAQYAYNLFNRTIEMDLRETLHKLNVGIIAYYPLAQGILSGKYSGEMDLASRANHSDFKKGMWDYTEEKIKKAALFSSLAKKYNTSASALALAWCRNNSQICSMLTHVSSEEQLQQNLTFQEIIISENLKEEIENIFQNSPVNPYTGATYQQ